MNIKQPTLIPDQQICKANLLRMANKAKKSNTLFRPHFKTHQSAEIGEWFRKEGVSKITASSVKMAEYFAEHGWKDIFIAFPVNINEIENINSLARKVKLHLSVESGFTAKFLTGHLEYKTGVYIKIDTGYHRTGIEADNPGKISAIVEILGKENTTQFTGFYTHAGHTYNAKSKNEILEIFNRSNENLINLKKQFVREFPEMIISTGDTPSCSVAENFHGIDEIRPGNFIFYDLMQFKLGSCKLKDIAVSVACPVVAKHKTRNEIVIYGGAVHLSKEYIIENDGTVIYGYIAFYKKNREWGKPLEGTYIKNLSQEHGIIKTIPEIFNKINIGDFLAIIPIHSCLTANLHDEYFSTSNMFISKM